MNNKPSNLPTTSQRFIYWFILPILALTLSACSFSLAEDMTPPPNAQIPRALISPTASLSGPAYPLVAPNPQEGKSIYSEKCAPCHGTTGLGDGERAAQLSVPVAALGDPAVARNATLADWYRVVTLGNLERFMPPFNSLTDRQRWDVVAYAMTLADPVAGGAAGQIDSAALYTENCAQCHGEFGQGNGTDAASLEAIAAFTNQAKMSQLSPQAAFDIITDGLGPEMPAYADSLSEDERWALTGYVRSLSFDLPGSQAASGEVTPVPAVTEVSSAPTPETPSTAVTASSITVQVTMESGQELPQDMITRLYAFDEMQLVYSTTLSSHVDGLFTFENIETPAGRVFMAGVEYGGVTYGSDVFKIEDPLEPVALSVSVYETTTDTAVLEIQRLHVFFDFSVEGQMDVVELIIITNPSDKAVVAQEAGGPVVQVYLPEGASNIQFQDGTLGVEYLAMPGGFADTRTIQPGVTDFQILVGFTLPYEDGLVFDQLLNYDVTTATILVPENGVKIKSDMLTDGGTRDVQGVAYHIYSTAGTVSDNLTLEFSGKPRSGSSGSLLDSLNDPQTRNGLLIGLGALGLVLVLAGIWVYRRQENGGDEYEDEEYYEDEEDELSSQETLMDAIIALDDLYKSGELPQEAYQQRRAVLKERLSALIQAESNGQQDSTSGDA